MGAHGIFFFWPTPKPINHGYFFEGLQGGIQDFICCQIPQGPMLPEKMLPVRAPGALWTRPKIATFVVFRRSEVKISGNVAYDDRIIVL